MGHMAISHIERQRIDNPSLVDITGYAVLLPSGCVLITNARSATVVRWC